MGRKINNRIGETRMMNCGMEATIIEWFNGNNITVRFTDETEIKNKKYGNFLKGSINNPNYKPHLGETKMMNCGMEATIIKWISKYNITIKFSDGTIVENKQYCNFIRGKIGNPNYKNFYSNKHIGEIKMMNCNMEATIVKWISKYNITVQFTDGTIVKNKQYCNFIRGKIGNPNLLTVYDHLGKGFHTEVEMCKYHKIPYGLYRSRIDIGKWSIEEALTIPKNMTLGEYKVRQSLDKYNIQYIHNKTIKSIFKQLNFNIDWEDFLVKLQSTLAVNNINWSKSKIERLRPDFILYRDKNNKITGVIEFDGEQHFNFVEYFFKIIEEFLKRSDTDFVKNSLWEHLEIPMLRIRYDQVDLIDDMVLDFINKPEKYITNHNTYLTEEEYWEGLNKNLNNINDSDNLGYNPA